MIICAYSPAISLISSSCVHDIDATLLLHDFDPFHVFPYCLFSLWKVITSCNSTKDDLVQEVESFNQRKVASPQELETANGGESCRNYPFRYLSHVRSYPTFTFGGSVGSRVATVAFLRI